jgi:hypothetical protein
MALEKITIDLVAMPLNLIEQKRAYADANLMVRPFWDPVLIDEASRLDPDAILGGGYSASWHIDPVTLVVTPSDWVVPEDGTHNFGAGDAIYESVKTGTDQPPLKNVVVYVTVNWEQYDLDKIPMGYHFFSSGAAGGIVGSWPKPGVSAGSGWTVRHARCVDTSGPVFSGTWAYNYKAPKQGFPHQFGDVMSLTSSLTTCWMGRTSFAGELQRINSSIPLPPGGAGLPVGPGITSIETGISFQTEIGDPDTGTPPSTNFSTSYQVFFNYGLTAYLVMQYEAKRQRTEQVRFTLAADLQPVFTDPGGTAADFAQDSELIQLKGLVGQEGPFGEYRGVWASNTQYFQNDIVSVVIGGVQFGYQVTRDHVSLPVFDEAAAASQFRGGTWLDAGTLVYSGGLYYQVLISGAWTVAPSPGFNATLDPFFQQPIYSRAPDPHSGPQTYQLVPGFRGAWTAGYTYIEGDIVFAPTGQWYRVAIGHVADATFYQFANDVTGALLYEMMNNPPPIGDVAASLYFPGDRGHWTIENAIMRARARLINRSRTISVSYNVLGDI